MAEADGDSEWKAWLEKVLDSIDGIVTLLVTATKVNEPIVQ